MSDPGADESPSLEAALDAAWALLVEGQTNRRVPAHTPALGTIGLDGRPRTRVVVLREIVPALRRLRFHTDRRSTKAAEIARDPRVSLLVYDAAAKLQVRIEGVASLHDRDAQADLAWRSSRPSSKVCYGIDPGPGSPIHAADGFALPSATGELEDGRANFLAVMVEITMVETLSLRHAGHRRARFHWGEGGDVSLSWLAP